MRLVQKISQYYRDPGNGRRLASSLLLAVMLLSIPYTTLKRTFWNTWDPSQSTAPAFTNTEYAFLALILLCLAGMIWLAARGMNKAPWWVRVLEKLPIIAIAVVYIAIEVLYRLQVT